MQKVVFELVAAVILFFGIVWYYGMAVILFVCGAGAEGLKTPTRIALMAFAVLIAVAGVAAFIYAAQNGFSFTWFM